MSYSISLKQQQKISQSLKQQQCLIMSPQMQQAIAILRAPVLEMASMMIHELEQNPILEYEEDAESRDIIENESEQDQEGVEEQELEKEMKFDDKDFEILRQIDEDYESHFSQTEGLQITRDKENDKLKSFLESSIIKEESLFEHLMDQARETFESKDDLDVAEKIIGNLDEYGYLNTPLSELSIMYRYPEQKFSEILTVIQGFHPHGVGASNLQESLLIQLRAQAKNRTLAYEIIDKHYDDLIHNRIPNIEKELCCTPEEIETEIRKHISRLDLHPGTQCSQTIVPHIVQDVSIVEDGDKLVAQINEEYVPQIRMNRRYLKMLNDESLSPETKGFIKEKLMSAKWLFKNIEQRNETLLRIAGFLAERQKEFFTNPEGNLLPLTMKEVAENIDVHESTIVRAVSNKYINTPRGLLPLRYFFTSSYQSTSGEEISSKTIRKLLQEMIDKEDKHQPISDSRLSQYLKDKGIPCARRTVAKYRSELNLGNAQQRKKH